MKKVCLCLFLFILYIARTFADDDPVSKVAAIIRQANMHELSALMAENIDVAVPGDENTYSKTRAAAVLTNFFNQNRPVSVKILHKINSSAKYHFGVLLMNTGKGVYRIALTFKEVNGAFQLIELRIETEKVK